MNDKSISLNPQSDSISLKSPHSVTTITINISETLLQKILIISSSASWLTQNLKLKLFSQDFSIPSYPRGNLSFHCWVYDHIFLPQFSPNSKLFLLMDSLSSLHSLSDPLYYKLFYIMNSHTSFLELNRFPSFPKL